MPSVKFITLGCKVNQYETQSIRERFLLKGFKEARSSEKADLYLVNTCTVTAVADQKSRNLIRSCLKDNPKARVIVTGCMVEADKEDLARIKGVSLIISKSFFSEGVSSFCEHTRAFLKIQDGCNNFCAYCKVPLVRGRSRSRSLEVVVKEARALVENGFKEIVLTGICLGGYGKDLLPKVNLVDLLKELEGIKGLLRIRLSSIEARDVTDSLVVFLATSCKACRHLHIPLQSGDDLVLKSMHRRDSQKSYLSLIKKIRKKIPGVGITTDIIVGFPGESVEAFKNTLRLLKAIEPMRVHVFPYSPRSGTAASRLAGAISPDEIKSRAQEARQLAGALTEIQIKSLLGKKVEVLFEGKSKSHPGFLEGYTDNYLKVISRASGIAANKVMNLTVKGLSGGSLLAE